MRLHPRSGAGRIKQDMSDEEFLLEHKDAAKSIQVSGAYLRSIWLEAVKVGKTPMFVIKFGNGMVLEGTIRKE